MPAGPEHHDALRAALVGDALEGLAQLAQLGLAALQRAQVRGSQLAGADQPPGGQRLRLAAHGQGLDCLRLELVADQPAGGVADQRLARRGRLLQAGRHVDRVARDERLARGRVPGDHLAAVDARADRDLHAPLALELAVQALQLLLQLERRAHRAPGMVLERRRAPRRPPSRRPR